METVPTVPWDRVTADIFLCPEIEEYNCPICLDVLKLPVQTTCGHLFCGGECGRSLTKCPTCRRSTTTYFDVFTTRRICNFRVKCINHACAWKGELSKLQEHLTQCPAEATPCIHCGTSVRRNLIEEHMRNGCSWCPNGCRERSPGQTLEKHLCDCCLEVVECPFRCKETFKREYLSTHLTSRVSEHLLLVYQENQKIAEENKQLKKKIEDLYQQRSQMLMGDYFVDGAHKLLGNCFSNGERIQRERVQFPKKMHSAPQNVFVCLSELDAWNGRNIRVYVWAENWTDEGFYLGVKTWGDSAVYGVRVIWSAIWQ